ncbi:MAG TPA: FAD-dependent oxidoreductase [Candidatus Dormibacteraeota bacterium]|nr:FAD-dependent oxidoreductase [Candidatus Dormibacteraeota bacterium]
MVGAGVIGSSIAYHLARSGAEVALLDPGSPRYPSASWASAGGVRRQGRDPREWQLTTAAWRRWAGLADELGADIGFRAGGHLHVAETEEELERLVRRAEAERAAGLEVELVDGAAARDLAPILSLSVLGGTWTAGDGQADPRRTTEAFQRAAVRHGAVFIEHAVERLKVSGEGLEVRAHGEIVDARWTVLAAGSWTAALVRGLGVRLPVRMEGLQMLVSDPDPRALGPTVGAEGRAISFKQLADGRFLVGGGWPADVDAAAHTCDLRAESIEGSWRAARGLFPSLAGRQIADLWCGLESISIDGVPPVGPLPGVEGAYLATGFCGHGFQLSPALGEAVARALGGAESPSLAPLSPDRQAGVDPERVDAFLAGEA